MLSGGRVILGVAPGYLKPEFAALGVDFDERNELTDEAIDVMRRVWTEDEVETVGRHFRTRGTIDAAAGRCSSRTRRSGSAATAPPRSGVRPSAGEGWVPFPNPSGRQLERAHAGAVEPRRARAPLGDPARARRRDRAHRSDRRLLLALRRRAPPRRSTSCDVARGARRHLGGAARPAVTTRAAWIDAVQQLGQDVIAPYRTRKS